MNTQVRTSWFKNDVDSNSCIEHVEELPEAVILTCARPKNNHEWKNVMLVRLHEVSADHKQLAIVVTSN